MTVSFHKAPAPASSAARAAILREAARQPASPRPAETGFRGPLAALRVCPNALIVQQFPAFGALRQFS
jgi:hypothetical protein